LKRIIGVLIVFGVIAAIASVLMAGNRRDRVEYAEVRVSRGDLTEKALAVGKIDPDHEVVVKSQVSGIVERIHREVGEQVAAGELLLTIKPEPTPLELAEARRLVEMAELDSAFSRTDLARTAALYQSRYISAREYESALKAAQEAELRVKQARERLELMDTGSSRIGETMVESVIRAPTSGTILERLVNVGDPVVPLTSYQPGTELMRIADMGDLQFIGTVDEIDVGKIRPGMRAVITVGALPGETLVGELFFISPKSRLQNNVVVFDIRIRITDAKGAMLRAGYSASADLLINEKRDVLYIPERVVTFAGDSAVVSIRDPESDSLLTRRVDLGFSDELSVEVLGGLGEGDMVVDR
jgi:HlyD family secretion protein